MQNVEVKVNVADSNDESNDRLKKLNAVHLILPMSMVPLKNVTLEESESEKEQRLSKTKQRLRGYNTLQDLRDSAARYRRGYLNWRKFKPKGARGETADVFKTQTNLVSPSSFERSLINMNTGNFDTSYCLSEVHTTYGTDKRRKAEFLKNFIKNLDEEPEWIRFYYNPFTPAENINTLPVCTSNLSTFAARGITVPTYSRDPTTVTHWILHVGVGQFHRAHQLVYLDKLLKNHQVTDEKWGYCGIGLLESDLKMANALRKQDLLYTILSRSNSCSEVQIIGSMFDYIYAYAEPMKMLKKLVLPNVYIVSLTVTEKGYCQNVDGELDLQNKNIRDDVELLKHYIQTSILWHSPRTALGFIFLGVYERWRNDLEPFAVLSCDNMTQNGKIARKMLIKFAYLVNREVAFFIKLNVKFPCCMVDRITPATDLEHEEILMKDYGIVDEWPVVSEDYMQWAIENILTIKPKWEQAGVTLLSNIDSLEYVKLRFLNGGHSVIAYLSYLANYQFVDDAVNDVHISSFLRSYMDELTCTINDPSVEIERYKEKIVERFGNRMIKDKLLRICEDGSTKFYNTLKIALETIIDTDQHVHCIALGMAGFIVFLATVEPGIIKDAIKDELVKLACKVYKNTPDIEATSNFLEVIYGFNLTKKSSRLVNHVCLALFALKIHGALNVLRSGGHLEALFDKIITDPEKFLTIIECLKTFYCSA